MESITEISTGLTLVQWVHFRLQEGRCIVECYRWFLRLDFSGTEKNNVLCISDFFMKPGREEHSKIHMGYWLDHPVHMIRLLEAHQYSIWPVSFPGIPVTLASGIFELSDLVVLWVPWLELRHLVLRRQPRLKLEQRVSFKDFESKWSSNDHL